MRASQPFIPTVAGIVGMMTALRREWLAAGVAFSLAGVVLVLVSIVAQATLDNVATGPERPFGVLLVVVGIVFMTRARHRPGADGLSMRDPE